LHPSFERVLIQYATTVAEFKFYFVDKMGGVHSL